MSLPPALLQFSEALLRRFPITHPTRLAIDLVSVLLVAVVLAVRASQTVPLWLIAYSAVSLVLVNAKSGQYAPSPGGWLLQVKSSARALALLAGALAIPHYFGQVPVDTLLVVISCLAALHVLSRSIGSRTEIELSLLRLLILSTSMVYLWSPFLGQGRPGSGDAYWYQLMLADFVTQWRTGNFPAFIGQSEYAFSGTVFPHRFAPLFQHTAGIIDLATGGRLSFSVLLSMTLLLAGLGGAWSMHRCMRIMLPGHPWAQLCLVLLFMASPGVLSVTYTGSLYMSVMTLPFIPWVVLGIWRSSRLHEPLPIGSIAAPLAASWLGHPPIAFWLSMLLAAALLTRWILLRQDFKKSALEAAKLFVLFVPLAAFVFVSVLTLESGEKLASVRAIVRSINGSFPGTLLPVSPLASLDSDYQLGLSVLLLTIASLVGWYRKPEISGTFLSVAVLSLSILLFPIPGLTTWIWNQLPEIVLEATYNWPMQRLTILALALAIMAIAWSLARLSRHGVPLRALLCLLWVGVVWSHWEARRFVGRATTNLIPAQRADIKLAPHNAVITRYSFFQHTTAPHFFSHGYVDPLLTLRLRSLDGVRLLESNRVAVERRPPLTSTPLSGKLDEVGAVSLRPFLSLSPGVRHYLSIEWQGSTTETKGTLSTYAKSVDRVYWLPDSAFGSTFATTNESFGIGGDHANGFSMWTGDPSPEQVEIRFTYLPKPTTPPPAHFMTVHDRTYTPDDLPIRVHSLVPLRVSAVSPEGGSLLGTPRMFVEGYEALVNNRPAEIVITPDRLVGIPLPAGAVEVELRFKGTGLLRSSYFIAIAAWIAVIAASVVVASRRWRATRLAAAE